MHFVILPPRPLAYSQVDLKACCAEMHSLCLNSHQDQVPCPHGASPHPPTERSTGCRSRAWPCCHGSPALGTQGETVAQAKQIQSVQIQSVSPWRSSVFAKQIQSVSKVPFPGVAIGCILPYRHTSAARQLGQATGHRKRRARQLLYGLPKATCQATSEATL